MNRNNKPQKENYRPNKVITYFPARAETKRDNREFCLNFQLYYDSLNRHKFQVASKNASVKSSINSPAGKIGNGLGSVVHSMLIGIYDSDS